jgi:hypothetical protein
MLGTPRRLDAASAHFAPAARVSNGNAERSTRLAARWLPRHRGRRREASGSGASVSSSRTPICRPYSETRSIAYPLGASSPMATAGKSIPPARSSYSVTGCWPALHNRSSIRGCWVSASAIDRIPRPILPGWTGRELIDGRESRGSTIAGEGPLPCRRRSRSRLSDRPSPCVDVVAAGLDRLKRRLGVPSRGSVLTRALDRGGRRGEKRKPGANEGREPASPGGGSRRRSAR